MAKSDVSRPTEATIKRLFARSGNRCAFPRCAVEIIQGDTLVGEICHIKAARPGGPRYDENQTSAERHSYDNLILLCGIHHTVVDDDEEAYTVDRLIKMKTDHEQRTTPLPDERAAFGIRLLIDQSVSAISQSGGITAHTVNIYAGKPSATPHPTPFPAVEPKDGPARFRALGAPLGIRDDPFFVGARNNVFLAAGPAMWLRLMPPVDPGKRWTSYDLKTVVGHGLTLQPLLWGSVSGYGGLYRIRAEDGVGCCSLLSRDAQETSSVAFAFETGEVWAIDTSLLGSYPSDLLVIEIEKLCAQRFREYASFLASLRSQPPYRWIAGLIGVRNRQLQSPS